MFVCIYVCMYVYIYTHTSPKGREKNYPRYSSIKGAWDITIPVISQAPGIERRGFKRLTSCKQGQFPSLFLLTPVWLADTN